MSDFRARLIQENDQLLDKIEKLKNFIVTGSFRALPDIERMALEEQLRYMQGYADVLSGRVSRLCNNA